MATSDVVEIPDDNSDNEVQAQQPQAFTVVNHAFDELRSLKSEMESRGSLLGKTWSELSNIMTRYQAQIIQKHEQLDNSLSGADYFKLDQMESELKRCRTDNMKLQKKVTELESKILEKDSEIVQLRTDFHKANNEVSMKNNLINKVQAQMAQEALDYQTEIAALKDALEQDNGDYGDRNFATVPVPVTSPQLKRRKISKPLVSSPQMTAEPVTPRNNLPSTNTPTKREPSSTPSISVKGETIQPACEVSGPYTSRLAGQSGMNSSYETTDQSFDNSMEGGGQDSFYAVGDVFYDSNSGMDGRDEGGVTGMQPDEQDEVAGHLAKIKSRAPCNLCGKTFKSNADLKRHIRIHTGERPLQCLICMRAFNQKITTLQHIRNVHKRFDAQEVMKTLALL